MNTNETVAQPSVAGAILRTGLFAGLLDISAAIINYVISSGKNPVRIFYYIASAAFGKGAYEMGWPMVLTGLAFHFTIALSFTALFFFIYPRIRILSSHIYITGLAYGIFIWLVMTQLVLRLTTLPYNGIKFSFQTFLNIFILMICVGLPVALLTNRFYNRKMITGK